ncbi:hypothetical protein GYH30_003838 [Glycine max]|nr:hypothetical protein GYH30_003838 [Glycine max]
MAAQQRRSRQHVRQRRSKAQDERYGNGATTVEEPPKTAEMGKPSCGASVLEPRRFFARPIDQNCAKRKQNKANENKRNGNM